MTLPLYHKSLQMVNKQSTGKSKASGTDDKNKTTCGVENSIEIQLNHSHGPMYLILQLVLSWLPVLFILILLNYSVFHQMESQKLEVAHLKTQINSLAAEVNFLRNQYQHKSRTVSTTDENSNKIANETENEAYLQSLKDPIFMFPRQKRGAVEEIQNKFKETSPPPKKLLTNNSARRGKQSRKMPNPGQARCRHQCQRRLSKSNTQCSGTQAIHLKGAHPETLVDGGRVGPWFIDGKAVKDSRISSPFQIREDGESVEVETSGLYFIYAQAYYLTSHALNSFTIMLVPKDSDNSVALAYCSTNAVSASSTSEVSCFTAVLRTLQAGDRIYVQQREKRRRLIMRPGHSFLGLVKFGAN